MDEKVIENYTTMVLKQKETYDGELMSKVKKKPKNMKLKMSL